MFLEKSDVCTNNKDINSALGVKSLTSFPSRHINVVLHLVGTVMEHFVEGSSRIRL